MLFAHDTELALQAAATLANSALEPDTMTTLADLDAWYTAHLYTGRRERTRAELEAVRAVRSQVRGLLLADEEDAADQVNAILEQSRAVPQLVRHEPFDWHLHAVPEESDLPTRILVETAMAMVDVVRAGELSRLGVCADDTCDGIVLDLSRNRSRRFCSTTCGNRNAVAAYRARQAAAEGLD